MKKEKKISDAAAPGLEQSAEMPKDDYIRSLELANQILRHEVEGLRAKLITSSSRQTTASEASDSASENIFSQCKNEKEVLLLLFDAIAKPYNVLECNFFLPDSNGAHLPAADSATTSTLPVLVSHFEEEGVVDWIAEGRIPKIIPDMEQTGELANTNILAIPIYISGKYFGIFAARVAADFAPELIPEIESLLEPAGSRIDAIRNSSAIDELNARIEVLNRQMQMSSLLASIGELTSAFSHEIDAPIEIIKANLNFLELGIGNSERRLQIIKEQTEKIADINHRLKKASEISHASGEMSHVNLVSLIDDAAAFSGAQLLAHGIKIDKQIESRHLNVKARSTQLEQAFIKILLNACHEMPEGGTITVVAFRTKNQTISVSFQDTGLGLKQSELEGIFDVNTDNKSAYADGLFMIKNVVEQHSGSISIVSEQGRGTTIRIVLPEAKTEVKKKSS